jgi:hypothetical protein
MSNQAATPEQALDAMKVFMIFIRNNPPQRLFSTVDFIDAYLKQLEERAKSGEWWRPLLFADDDGTIMGAYIASDIIGIIRGTIEVEAENVRK